MSFLEMYQGYIPALAGLPQTPVSEDIQKAHHSETVRRAIQRKDKSDSVLSIHLLPRNREVFYFVKGT